MIADAVHNMHSIDIETVYMCIAFVHEDHIVPSYVVFPRVWHATMATLVRIAPVAISIG